MGDEKTFGLVPADGGYGKPHPLGQNANGDYRIVDFVMNLRMRHKCLYDIVL